MNGDGFPVPYALEVGYSGFSSKPYSKTLSTEEKINSLIKDLQSYINLANTIYDKKMTQQKANIERQKEKEKAEQKRIDDINSKINKKII